MVNLSKPALNEYAGDAEVNAWQRGNDNIGNFMAYRDCVAVKKRYMQVMADKKYDTVV